MSSFHPLIARRHSGRCADTRCKQPLISTLQLCGVAKTDRETT